MKSFCAAILLLFFGGSLAFGQCPVIPLPASYHQETGSLDLSSLQHIIVENQDLREVGHFLQQQLLTYKGLTLPEAIGDHQQAAIFIGKESGIPVEGYHLQVTQSGVRITASDPHGAFNGVITLLQLARISTTDAIAFCRIEDKPQMKWRGIMLDESRHFFGKQAVEQILDWMAFYKLDRFHWHLSDEPGWRLQIRRYPKLALVGGVGNYSDTIAPAAYYTQHDIDEIVRYAKERFITIIPEIDMPGHAGAANRAYPQFSGGGTQADPDFTFNPGKEGIYSYLTNILREVNVLFPSGLIHIGGDEVSIGSGHWTSFPGIQKLMASEGLKNAADVEHYFIKRMADSVIKMGDKILGWDEIAQADLPPKHTIIFWWRHEKPASLRMSLDKGYDVVLCPRIPFYFDFVQAARDLSGRRWSDGKFSSEEEIYNYAVENYSGVITSDNRHQILGVQANLWTEKVASKARLQYMLFPRMAALSEATWTARAQRNDYDAFKKRVSLQDVLYQKQHLKYYDLQHPERTPEIIDEIIRK